jgi:LysR family hydrogen peroxide-inducible transcriptional activator
MEIHQLRYFAKVAELGSFTRAAQACFVTQPSLSQQIIKLEAELGRALFERVGRRVLLTDAGRRLKPIAEQILRLLGEVKERIGDDPEAGRLIVGAPPTVVPYFLSRVLGEYARRFPKVQVEVVEEVSSVILRKCLDCDLDLAVLPLPVDGQDLRIEPLFDEELFLMLPIGHHLVTRPEVTLDDLREENFILLQEAHCLSGNALGFCQQRRFQPIVTSRVNQLSTIQELVSLGQGVSLIPEMARRVDADPRRVYRSLSDDRPMRTLGLVRLAQRQPDHLAERFAETLREMGALERKTS